MSDETPQQARTPTVRKKRPVEGQLDITTLAGRKQTNSTTTFKETEKRRGVRLPRQRIASNVGSEGEQTDQSEQPEPKRVKVNRFSRTAHMRPIKPVSVPLQDDQSPRAQKVELELPSPSPDKAEVPVPVPRPKTTEKMEHPAPRVKGMKKSMRQSGKFLLVKKVNRMEKTGSDPQFKGFEGSARSLKKVGLWQISCPSAKRPAVPFEFFDDDDELDVIAEQKRRKSQERQGGAFVLKEKLVSFANNVKSVKSGGKRSTPQKKAIDGLDQRESSVTLRYIPVVSIAELKEKQFLVVEAAAEAIPVLFENENVKRITVTASSKSIALCEPVRCPRQIRVRNVPAFRKNRSNLFLKLCVQELYPVIVSSGGLTRDNIEDLAEKMVDEDDIQPFHLVMEGKVPLFSGMLKAKGKKGSAIVAKLLCSKRIVMGDMEIPCGPDDDVTIDEGDLRITNGRNIVTLRPNSDEEGEVWKRQIDALNNGTSIAFLDLCLFCLSSYAIMDSACEKADQVIAAVASPHILFTVDLLDRGIGIDQILNILICTNRMDFFVRTILLAEISATSFSDLFKKPSRYTNALASLFVASSRDWIRRFSFLLFDNENKWDALLKVLYTLMSCLPDNGLYIMRTILLTLLTTYDNENHSMLPLLEFLRLVLVRESAQSRYDETQERAFRELRQILVKNSRADHVLILELCPFFQKIISTTPKLTGDVSKLDEQALNLYALLLKDVKAVNNNFTAAMNSANPQKHPLVLCYRHILKAFIESP